MIKAIYPGSFDRSDQIYLTNFLLMKKMRALQE